MVDLIDRQAAIDALGDIHPLDYNAQAYKARLEKLPSAQPERKKGKWIIVTDSRGRHAECPYCGEWEYHSNQKFCGECGAKMKEEEE